MNRTSIMTAVGMAVGLAGTLGLAACTNPDVPAGHEGYIHHIPLIFGQMEYRDSLPGPASTGLSWRLYTTNVDMREQTWKEKFDLLSSDDLKVSFEVATRISLKPNTVKELVEEWGGEKWYEWNVKEPLRTIIRREIMKVSATKIQLETDDIRKRIETALRTKYKDTPIVIASTEIGSFEFPTEVAQAIQEKVAKQQELERQITLLERTHKDAAIEVFTALKEANEQRIISETLDPLYLQWRGVQIYRKLASSSNKTVMMLPNTAQGTGMPQVLTQGKRKVLSPDDLEFLEEIETRYLQKVTGAEKLEIPSLDTPTGAAVDGAAPTDRDAPAATRATDAPPAQ